MVMRCLSGHHVPVPGGVRNQGFEFSHCAACRRDLVRSNQSWKPVPSGFRVVWRGKTWQPEAEPSSSLDPADVGIALAVPVVEPRRERISSTLSRAFGASRKAQV